jgi:hypothetical protein
MAFWVYAILYWLFVCGVAVIGFMVSTKWLKK